MPACGHLPQGRCGLKLQTILEILWIICHLPQGRCGLKLAQSREENRDQASPSARKVWIEIYGRGTVIAFLSVTFRKEGVDWNINMLARAATYVGHLPQGRCGLKSTISGPLSRAMNVTFRKEGVDWNATAQLKITGSPGVTFRKEGVDWNGVEDIKAFGAEVTFRKEGVDWNRLRTSRSIFAWVTFRKEGVDWNLT